ncbi:MAG: dGTP triphosphohydrolase [Pseudomonadota bacterium]
MDTNSFGKILDLLKPTRLRPSTRGEQNILIESESDKARVINHAAFRRLLGKAQVFPLDTNAAVRTRLTHSIEVSQIGRYIAQKIIEKHDVNSLHYKQLAAFVTTIETACLLHDIGNPPFGHFGEDAIQKWFLKETPKIADLLEFDGNPQGFRLISFLGGADEYGLNLTCSQLLSTIKYPWTHAGKPDPKDKIGLFTSDVAYYKRACDELNWPPGKKFPFLRLMEAADNIAYAMSDLEDGIEKKIVSIEDLKKEFGENRFLSEKIDPFVKFKTDVIVEAVELAAKTFTNKLDNIIAGEDIELVDKTSDIGDLLKKVKHFARAKIYRNEAAERIELAGRSVIVGLLNHFKELLDLEEAEFMALVDNNINVIKDNKLGYHARLLRRLPISYIEKYRCGSRGGCEIFKRAHLVVDFISGMTDEFALETYQVLEGIRIR